MDSMAAIHCRRKEPEARKAEDEPRRRASRV